MRGGRRMSLGWTFSASAGLILCGPVAVSRLCAALAAWRLFSMARRLCWRASFVAAQVLDRKAMTAWSWRADHPDSSRCSWLAPEITRRPGPIGPARCSHPPFTRLLWSCSRQGTGGVEQLPTNRRSPDQFECTRHPQPRDPSPLADEAAPFFIDVTGHLHRRPWSFDHFPAPFDRPARQSHPAIWTLPELVHLPGGQRRHDPPGTLWMRQHASPRASRRPPSPRSPRTLGWLDWCAPRHPERRGRCPVVTT